MSFSNINSSAEMLKPKITIFGVGGAGGNAINNMIRSSLEGVEFVAANTDAQSISNSLATNKIQLGIKTTRGLGAGSFPDRGKASAEENIEEIQQFLEGANMVFIAAGMGGGTGTGAAPVIAKLARERDILTVGVVTKPFHFEGKYRMETAEAGIEELKKYVDTLIVIPNQNLFRVANENTTFESAFKMADDVLHAGVRGITDLITMPGLVNLDFADIRTIMTKMGKAMMGTGEAQGDNRALDACEAAISNPLLDNISIKGAKGVLVNMTGGPDMTLFEADIAVNAIKKEVDANANIIFGSAFNENMKGKIRISVVATGIDVEEFNREAIKEQNREANKNDQALKNQKINAELNRFNVNRESNQKFSNDKTFFDPGIAYEIDNQEIQEIDAENFSVKNNYNTQPAIDQNLNYNSSLNQTSIDENSDAKNEVNEINLGNKSFDFFENEISEEEHELDSSSQSQIKPPHHKPKTHSNPVAKPAVKQSHQHSKDHNPKKESPTGFNLFGFMNSKNKKIIDDQEPASSSKNHRKPIEKNQADNDDFEIENNESSPYHQNKNYGVYKKPSNVSTHAKENNFEAEKKRKQFFGETIFDEDDQAKSRDNFEEDILNVPAFLRRKK